jgi:hypothetical protein
VALEAKARLRNSDDTSTAEGIHTLINATIEDVRENRIPINTANCIGYLSQLLMANLERLDKERKANDPDHVNIVDLNKRFHQVLADDMLDKQEEEIRRLGENAFPLQAAKNHAEYLRRKGAAASSPQFPQSPQPPPDVSDWVRTLDHGPTPADEAPQAPGEDPEDGAL